MGPSTGQTDNALAESNDNRDAFLRALGWVALQGGMLEEALVDLYWVTKRVDETALIDEVRKLTLGPLKDLAMNAFLEWATEPALTSKAQLLEPRLAEAVHMRNEHLHAGWAFGGKYLWRSRLPRGGPIRGEYLDTTASDVAHVGDLIGDAAEAVWEFYDDVIDRTDPSLLPASAGIVLPDGTYVPCASRMSTG